MKFFLIIFLFITSIFAKDIEFYTSLYENTYTLPHIEEVFNKEFKLLKNNKLNKGLSKNGFWIKITINNKSNQTHEKVLYIDNYSIDTIKLYKNKQLFFQAGDMIQKSENVIQNFGYGFPLILEKNSSEDFYIFLKSRNAVVINFSLQDIIVSKESFENKKHFLSIYTGFVLAILIYNLFLFITIRDKVYFYYLIFQGSLFLMLLAISGYGVYYVWVGNFLLNGFIIGVFDDISLVFALFFIKEFLQTNQYYKKINFIFNILIVLSIIVMVDNGFIHNLLVRPVMIGSILLALIFSIYIMFKDKSITKYYFIGLFSLIIGALMMLGRNFNWLESNFFTDWSIYFGSMFDALFFSMALAQKINHLKKENEEILLLHNKQLHKEVKKQTKQLQKELQNKEVLMREIHHRVKNNLQLVLSFINIASLKKTQDISETFKALEDRIRAIASLHEYLYDNEDLANVNISEYIETLIEGIQGAHHTKNITFNTNIQNQKFNFEQIIILGITINELIINSIKYAFKSKKKANIGITLIKNRVIIEDNGRGFDIQKINHNKISGINIIKRIIEKQLGGNVKIRTNNKGTRFIIKL